MCTSAQDQFDSNYQERMTIEITPGITGYFSVQRDGRHGSCSARNAIGNK